MASILASLSEDQIRATEDKLVALISELYPLIDLSPGTVLRDLLIRPAAVLSTNTDLTIEQFRKSLSLLEIEANPDNFTDEDVNRILSNFLLVRDTGSKASGQITVVVSESILTTIASDTIFTSITGEQFTTVQAFNGVTSSALIATTADRLLVQRADGNYAFTIDVVALNEGVDGQVRKSIRFSAEPEPPNVVDIFAAADFTGGKSSETNSELIGKLTTGITINALSGRSNIDALLRKNFDSIIDVSVIGFGDSEMSRDKNNLFGLSTGGKVDIYVRTSILPVRKIVTKPAILRDSEKQYWTINFGRDEFPAMYTILGIRPNSEVESIGNLEIVKHERGLDFTDIDFVPALARPSDGFFSSFQTNSVTFYDPASNVLGSNIVNYEVEIAYLPEIDAIQEFVSDRKNRNPQADYLVRATIPCFLAADMTIYKHPLDEDIDIAKIQRAVANKVNSLRFENGALLVSDIVNTVSDLLPIRSSVKLPINVYGFLIGTDGVDYYISETNIIEPPKNLLTQGVSSRTVSYFLEPTSIDISILELDVKSV